MTLLTPSVNRFNSLRGSTIFMITLISLFEILSVLMSDSYIFFWIAVCVAATTAVYFDGVKMFLANGVSAFLLIVNQLSLLDQEN